ncbi:MAG: hypothetical protein ACRDQ5_29155 [Sciscionella sp.]
MPAAPNPAEVFDLNLRYARGLISGGHSLENLLVGILDPADLYRAAWTQSVSAFDHWLHEEIYSRTPRLVRQGPAARPRQLSEVTLPFDLVDRIQNADIEIGIAFSTHLRGRIGRVSFHQSRAISEAVQYVVEMKHGEIWSELADRLNGTHQPARPWTVETAQAEHKRIIDRRNEIAHMADLDPDTNERRPMSSDDASAAVSWVADLRAALTALMNANTA